MIDIPRPALIYSEASVKLLEMNERDKAYELLVLAGSFAIREALENPAPIEPIKEKK